MTEQDRAPRIEDGIRRRVAAFLASEHPETLDVVEHLGRRYDAGLAWVHFPRGRGGLGGEPSMQAMVEQLFAAAGAPEAMPRNPIGHGMGAPTLLAYGTGAQLDRYLRPLYTGEEVWCQLFSEPGAGSDVAGLATRARRNDDSWLINGQKVWTSFAHIARFGMLLARTDPDVPKHSGLTYFIVDMRATGVEVRPLVQLTSDAEFNEVFFTDVALTDADVLGYVADGWSVAMATLMHERVALGGRTPRRGQGPIADALDAWERRDPGGDQALDDLMRLWVDAEALRLMNIRSAQLRRAGVPGPEGSVGKLIGAELNQRASAFAAELLGMEGMLFPGGYNAEHQPDGRRTHDSIQRSSLRALANTIEGGTGEIMRNILGERVLGLPPDLRVDKDVAWSQVL
jgi:alkylation response protein AidB-like acyl-CoA dehydrogenase